MATSQVSDAIQQLHKAMLVQEAPDGKLLESFVTRREAAALEALVRRHGPMVWNVCRRVLRNQQDAEDAFQATFLVFVRKAASIVPRDMVGNWLYGVAHQTALKANATTAKRRTREKQVPQMPESAMTEHEHWTDLQPILDQEISRLPDHYRVAIVLCDLEGKTRSQAAQQLGCPEGTVAGRLARARTTLAKRLVQRGIVLSAGALAAVLSQQAASACVPDAVMKTALQTAALVATGRAATAAIPANVAVLTEGVVKAMLMAKLKTGACALLMVGMVTLACGMLAFGMTNAGADAVDKPAVIANKSPKDAEGDKDNTWQRLKKGDLLAVDVERGLYEVKGEKRFLMAVRLTNLTKGEIGADWQAPLTCLYANQWGVHDTMQRGIVDERRAVHAAPDQDKVRADFQAGRLLRIPAGKSVMVWTEFNNGGRADVHVGQGKYLIVSMDGQFCATDGATVDIISCAWKKGVGPKETDVVMPFPVKWQTKQAKVKVDKQAKTDAKPKAAEDDKENSLTVTIKPQKDRIRADEPFNIDVRVVNSSKLVESFRVMSGSWDGQWKSSNERVTWDPKLIGKDVEQKVILEPGNAYEKTGAMRLRAGKEKVRDPQEVARVVQANLESVEDVKLDLTLRAEAARQLGGIGDKASAVKLVKALPQAEGPLFVEIAVALGKIGNVEVLPQLLAIQQNPGDRSGKSNSALGHTVEALQNPQEKVTFKLGFSPIGSNQTFWSNEITVEVDQGKKQPRFVPIASYPAQDRAAEKRIRELLDAAKITFGSASSLGVKVSVAEDKAKQARAILEKAVVDKTLSVQVLEQLPMPKNLKAVRTDDKLRIEEDTPSNEEVIVPVAAGLIRATECELSVYRGKERVSHTGGTYMPPFERTRANSKIPQPGESYEIELVVKWFETDAPIQPNWKPESGGKYKLLVTRTLKVSVGPENTKPAPLDKQPLPRGNAALPELAKKCKGAVVATLQEFGNPELGPPGAADYASKWKVEKVLRGAYPETAHLSFRVQSLPIERRERLPAVGKTYILITYEDNANQVAAILDADAKNLREVQDLLTALRDRWDKLLEDKKLTAKQRAAYAQIAKLHSIKIGAGDWGSIPIPTGDAKLPTDVLFAMGFDALPMLAEALDDETPTTTMITQREGNFKYMKAWQVNDFAALLIVRIADRDFVIGASPKELGIRDIAERPKTASEFRKLVVSWHAKFATKTQTERKIADVSDPWFRNRFDAIISFGNGKVKEARAPITAHVDAFYADKNREVSSLTRAEMSHCALALGQIGDKADLPQVRKVCKDMSYWLKTYGIQDSGMLEDLFRSYQGLTLLGEKDEAINELERLFTAHGGKFEERSKKEFAERLKEAKGETKSPSSFEDTRDHSVSDDILLADADSLMALADRQGLHMASILSTTAHPTGLNPLGLAALIALAPG